MKYEFIIFDLDGTLLDTSPGIFNSVRYALRVSGLPSIEESKLPEFVGPPPRQKYMELYNLDEESAFNVVKKHREYGRTKAIYESSIYPGIVFALNELKSLGYKLGVATLKSQEIAEAVLENQGLTSFMDIIVGMDENESLTKTDMIHEARRLLNVKGKTVMIGDSLYDYEGAVEAGVDFIGVLYGFGFKKGEEKSIKARLIL